MRCRASQTLAIHPRDGRYLIFNFLAKTAFSAGSGVLLVLEAFQSWRTSSGLFPEKSPQSVARELKRLLELGALVKENSYLAEREKLYLAQWEWNVPTGLLHFGLEDRPYISSGLAVEMQKKRAFNDPSPPLYLTHSAGTELPKASNCALNRVIVSRRTCRETANKPITLRQLADCLFAGLDIVDEVVTETGSLPLSTTPSGGARNPFEAYVLARRIDGLDAGLYHYSAKQHSLRKVGPDDGIAPSRLLGDQDWADHMPCIIFLVAFLERTMWKYSDSNAYRVVLIEAGHIGQNIMLAATQHGLSACPTAALAHSAIRRMLGLERLTQAPLYALTLSVPA